MNCEDWVIDDVATGSGIVECERCEGRGYVFTRVGSHVWMLEWGLWCSLVELGVLAWWEWHDAKTVWEW